MDFVDWRKPHDKPKIDTEAPKPKSNKFYGKAYMDYIEEQIRDAQERGEFDNLPGAGMHNYPVILLLDSHDLDVFQDAHLMCLQDI